MKVKTTNNNTFNPITLEITIESEDELKNLWAALNIPTTEAEKYNKDLLKEFELDDSVDELFDVVDEYVTKLGLKKEEI